MAVEGTVIGILPRETTASQEEGGEGREEWDTREEGISRPTQSALGGCGSRQRAVESYIFGSRPVSKKRIIIKRKKSSRCKSPGSGVESGGGLGGSG